MLFIQIIYFVVMLKLVVLLVIFLVVLSPECLLFVDDFSPTHGTHGSGKKFYMSSHTINSTTASVKSTKPNKSRRLLSADSLK